MSDLPNKLNNMCEMFWLGHTIRNVDMVKEAADLIEQQAAEIEALKAHVERLRSIAFPYVDLLPELVDWFDDTPYQYLAEHDAEVVQEFLRIEAPLINPEGLDPDEHCCECILHDERVRLHKAAQSGKE